MRFRLALTGNIGMGKSTTAAMFAEEGCAVWDADAAVHRLYGPGGAAVAPMAAEFPEAVIGGEVSRPTLKEIIGRDRAALRRIEAIVHPLVAEDREAFITAATAPIVVLDIPLLFETGAGEDYDAVACVTIDPETQRARVLERGTMTPEQFAHIASEQRPIADKVARADYVIETDTPEHARAQVREVIADIGRRMRDA